MTTADDDDEIIMYNLRSAEMCALKNRMVSLIKCQYVENVLELQKERRTLYFYTKKLEIINACIHSCSEYETFYGTGSLIQFENYMEKEQMPSCR